MVKHDLLFQPVSFVVTQHDVQVSFHSHCKKVNVNIVLVYVIARAPSESQAVNIVADKMLLEYDYRE